MKRQDRRAKRQEQARERQAVYDKLSPYEKLAKLDTIFGRACGAIAQRAKLKNAIAKKGK